MRAHPAGRRNVWPARARALEHVLLVVVPLLVVGLFLNHWSTTDAIGVDFHHYYWPAGDRVLHGLSPYVYGPWYPSEVPVGFVYPAPTAVLFAGVSAIPRGIGDVAFITMALGAPLLALRLLDVNDWRVYPVVLLWPPILFGVQTANLSLLFTVAVAAMWRSRDRAGLAGPLLGVIVAMKLFLFPLGLFLLVTRRYVALAYGVATALSFTAIAWLIVGTDEIARYRATVKDFTLLREDYGYSLVGLVERLGGERPLAYAVAIALAAAAALGCAITGRRGDERGAFVLALAAGLIATPIMWLHYLALLIVPVGLACPRLHPLWALPLLLFYSGRWVGPSDGNVAIALLLASFVVAASLGLLQRRARAASPSSRFDAKPATGGR